MGRGGFILEKNVILEGNNALMEIKCWDGEQWERVYLKEGEGKASQEGWYHTLRTECER